jgi:hypothetical protein
MVSKKGKNIALVVYDHEFNSIPYLTEVLRITLGYHITQASNCAHIITNIGKYRVRVFKAKDMEKAKAMLNMLSSQEVPAELLFI